MPGCRAVRYTCWAPLGQCRPQSVTLNLESSSQTQRPVQDEKLALANALPETIQTYSAWLEEGPILQPGCWTRALKMTSPLAAQDEKLALANALAETIQTYKTRAEESGDMPMPDEGRDRPRPGARVSLAARKPGLQAEYLHDCHSDQQH